MPKDFDDLWEGFLAGTLSNEELKLFLDARDDDASHMSGRISGLLHDRAFAGSGTQAQRDRIFEALTKKIYAPRIPIKRILRWTAAASILVIGTGAYMVLHNRKPVSAPTPETTQSQLADIAPGSAKAILTLADNKQIILDSAAYGELAKQGSTKITKLASGQLAYNVLTEKPSAPVLATAPKYNTLTTPRGGQYQLILPDGTKVWLNASSSITYPTAFTGNERKVTVTGEAYFEVIHNKLKPLSVAVNGTIIQDIGTSFNINGYGDDNLIKTTLIEGSVKIITTKQSRQIKPGQQAITQTGSPNIELAKDVDLEKVIAWHNGKMMLSNVSVEQIMREISRWYDMDIEYAGKIPEKQFYGSVRRDVKLSTILNALRDYGVQTKIENKKIIVQ